MTRTPRIIATALLALVLSAGVALAAGACAARPGGGQGPSGPSEPVVPPTPDLTTPENAVRSYVDWVSLAYRLANSAVASQTYTPYEEVRVDAYIQLNKQEDQGIEQTLVGVEIRGVTEGEPTSTVAMSEEWRYRYFDLSSLTYKGEEHTASYETTYTVVRQPDGRWLVDSVEARPLTEVP